ncbi:acyltransferase family protein [Yinghuangia sp. ASG 101]|uniref:acyltransferase n=1 Tax=Yinghuangia sp. ASG 101 TaxID=2896848 RepID=UPI001E2D2259|nr:acyltransferase family protein [Yinghuangia sp. ASG 101]UGQ10885.1 acyltransferase family protein [Yinghuangia sp. ASG 101]
MPIGVPPVPRLLRRASAPARAVPRVRTADLPAARGPGTAERPSYAYLSWLRVIAIVAVVSIHTTGLTMTDETLRGSAVWWTAAIVNVGSTWAVPVFVMISGALLLRARPGEDAYGFYRRRLARIAVPLVFWHAFYIAFKAAVKDYRPTLDKVVGDLLLARTYTALYFFWLILGLYLVAPVLRVFLAKASSRDRWLITGLAVAFGIGVQITNAYIQVRELGAPALRLTAPTYFLPYVGYFMLGHMLRDVVLTARQRLVAAVLLVLATTELVWQHTHAADLPLDFAVALPPNTLGPVTALCSALVFLLARGTLDRAGRVGRATSDLVLGVFGCHLAVLYGFQQWYGMRDGATTLPGLALLLGSTVAAAFAISLAASRVPLLRKAF